MIGQTVSHYRVQECLGSGGMAVVYAAEDLVLKRRVALKFPAGDETVDRVSAERFLREARSASALNHPNICTIYEADQFEGRPFLAMELVDGTTLRQRIDGRPLPAGPLLDLAIQISDALDTAHVAGIVHRDIKPSNIMVTRRGQAKVMDFGLAKLVPHRTPPGGEASATAIAEDPLTTRGAAIGTVAYMSPEQARGELVDARSDLFSLGLVLYEMATGRTAFGGSSNALIFDAILNRAPVAAHQFNPMIPAELERIIAKALEKDREERYQTAADLRADLKRLKRQLESGRREGSGAPESTGVESQPSPDAPPGHSPAGDNAVAALAAAPETTPRVPLRVVQGGRDTPPQWVTPPPAQAPSSPATTAPSPSAAAPSTARVDAAPAARGHGRTLRTAALLVMPVLVAAAGWYAWTVSKGRVASPTYETPAIEALTFTGKVGLGAISADGRYVVHTEQDGQTASLWMRQVATSSHVPIVPAAEGQFDGLTLSPDGNYVYYTWYARGENMGVVYRLPTLGGTPQRVLDDVDTPIAFAPDASRIAFIRGDQAGNTNVVVAKADGSEARTLASRGRPKEFLVNDIGWSPDGKFIAVAERDRRDARIYVAAIDVGGGAERRLIDAPWFGFSGLVWRPDGKGLIATGTVQPVATTGHQIYEIPWPEGAPRRISSDLGNYSWPRLTADGRTLSVIRDERNSRLWTLPAATPGDATAIGVNGDGSAGIDIASDGALVYTSMVAGRPDLWLVEPGQAARALTADDASEWAPAFTPDGKHVVYHAVRGEKTTLYRIDRDGTHQAPLAETSPTWGAVVTPDGQWVYFTDSTEGIKRVPIGGGKAEPVTTPALESLAKPVTLIAMSPDGQRMAVSYQDAERRGFRVAVVAADGGGTPVKLDLASRWLRFSADGQSLIYSAAQKGVGNVVVQPIAGGPAKPVTDFKSEALTRFAISPDGRTIAATRGTVRNDLILLRDQGSR